MHLAQDIRYLFNHLVISPRSVDAHLSCEGLAMPKAASAWIMLIQKVRKCVPAAAHTHHNMITQDLQSNRIEICYDC